MGLFVMAAAASAFAAFHAALSVGRSGLPSQ